MQETKKDRPFWRYQHNDTVMNPRINHVDLDGLVLPADDPFWNRAYPPSGFGCRCYVESVSKSEMKRKGYKVGTAPADFEPDRGWDYAPGKSLLDEMNTMIKTKAEALPKPLARAWLASIFARVSSGSWWAGLLRSIKSIIQGLR
jgi:uncharacterized protein with gpF-like domain